jgi:alpha/beta hydrolase family protein
VPFTQAQLKKLYPTHVDYVHKVEQDTRKLATQGWLIPMDVTAIIKAAQQSDVP